jgi:hypothetical protein
MGGLEGAHFDGLPTIDVAGSEAAMPPGANTLMTTPLGQERKVSPGAGGTLRAVESAYKCGM